MDDTVKILTHDYSLIEKSFEDEEEFECGYCCFDDQEINIDHAISSSMKAEVLIHEILETLNYHLELNLKHPQITQIALGFSAVLKDNNKLIRSYIKKMK